MRAVNYSQSSFAVEYLKTQCSVEIPRLNIHHVIRFYHDGFQPKIVTFSDAESSGTTTECEHGNLLHHKYTVPKTEEVKYLG
jgi:hypothetical protein